MMMRHDVLQRASATVASIALALEDVATTVDDEDLSPENRRRIDGAIRRAQRELELVKKGLAASLSELEF